MEQVLERLIYNVEQSEDYRQLEQQRPHTRHRTVMLSLIQRGLCVDERILVVDILKAKRIELRLHLDHLDGVFLHEHRYREHDYLRAEGENYNGYPVVTSEEIIQKTHKVAERRTNYGIDYLHALLPFGADMDSSTEILDLLSLLGKHAAKLAIFANERSV